MSAQPHGLSPDGENRPTGVVPPIPASTELHRPFVHSPHGYRRPSTPRAALSHSSSVRSRRDEGGVLAFRHRRRANEKRVELAYFAGGTEQERSGGHGAPLDLCARIGVVPDGMLRR